jgi:hypothetical protein
VTKVKIKVKIKINGARKNKGAQNGIVLRLEGRRTFTQAWLRARRRLSGSSSIRQIKLGACLQAMMR